MVLPQPLSQVVVLAVVVAAQPEAGLVDRAEHAGSVIVLLDL